KNIVKINSLFVGSVIVLLLVAVVLGNAVDFRAAFTFIKNGIVSAIKIFFSGFAFVINLVMKMFRDEPAEGTGEIYVPHNPTRESNFAAGESIIVVLKILLLIAFVYVVVRIIVKIIKALLVKQQGMLDIVEEAEIERTLVVESTGIKRMFNVLFSPEEKLRKMYKKHILGYSYDIKLKNSSTCKEIQNEIMKNTNEDLSTLTELYSDVRYGGKPVDRGDLKKIKQLTSKR
ncbi:MAG: DUF4129 domain-containing protein, partial [Lachnospiraceae bacterium]|nr:DUF4129 domain-containing protein [Lachnospiraceae bacterium]